jgi:hypothetical protein
VPDPLLDESALSAFRRRSDSVVSDGLRALVDGLARSSELSQQAVEARAESAVLLAQLQDQGRVESAGRD